jgi:hypothetical protein
MPRALRDQLMIIKAPHERTNRRRARFLELLKTVDGLFLQRHLALPEERWTWQKFDLFTLQNISVLLTDEFCDFEWRR